MEQNDGQPDKMVDIDVRQSTADDALAFMKESGRDDVDSAVSRAIFAARCTHAFDSMTERERVFYLTESREIDVADVVD